MNEFNDGIVILCLKYGKSWMHSIFYSENIDETINKEDIFKHMITSDNDYTLDDNLAIEIATRLIYNFSLYNGRCPKNGIVVSTDSFITHYEHLNDLKYVLHDVIDLEEYGVLKDNSFTFLTS